MAEDTVTVNKTMRAASPPASVAELIEATGVRRGLGRMAKQCSLDEMGLDLDDEPEEFNDDSPRPDTPLFCQGAYCERSDRRTLSPSLRTNG